MATDRKKPYTIYKSQATGWWCCEVVGYDENNVEVIVDQQCFPTKKEAKKYAKEHYGNGSKKNSISKDYSTIDIRILPPHVDAVVRCGHLMEFSVMTPIGTIATLTMDDMSENTALWYFGMDCFDETRSERWELVACALMTWGLFRGGNSEEEIMNNHNLSPELFNLIADKKWSKLIADVHEEDHIEWTIYTY